MYFKFSENDKFINYLVTYPEYEVVIDYQKTWINNRIDQGTNVPKDSINVYELNVNRSNSELIYPFLPKNGDYTTFRTVSDVEYASASYGTNITGVYPITASVLIENFTDMTEQKVESLKNIVNKYKRLSSLSSFETVTQNNNLTIIQVPRLFIGSGFQKGTVKLDYYYTGSLISSIVDSKLNGDLVVSNDDLSDSSYFTSGSTVVGSVLYDDGIILLYNETTIPDFGAALWPGSYPPAWTNFGLYRGDPDYDYASHFKLSFNGISKIPVVTMFCYAPKYQLNNSTNPTFISSSSKLFVSSSNPLSFTENEYAQIKNLSYSQYSDSVSSNANVTSSFEKITTISKIGIYNKDKELIGIAKLANPVIKKENKDFAFKLKLDL